MSICDFSGTFSHLTTEVELLEVFAFQHRRFFNGSSQIMSVFRMLARIHVRVCVLKFRAPFSKLCLSHHKNCNLT